MSTEALKPCPFCGGEAQEQVHYGRGASSHSVWCSDCNCGTAWMVDRDAAISLWNRRSAPAAGTDQDAERYKVVEGSQSAHCCFDFTVVDTTMPVMIHGEHYKGQFEAVCETFDREDAESIRDALNGARSIPEKLAAIQQNAEQKQTCPPARDEGNSAEVNYDRAQLQALGQHEEKNG